MFLFVHKYIDFIKVYYLGTFKNIIIYFQKWFLIIINDTLIMLNIL